MEDVRLPSAVQNRQAAGEGSLLYDESLPWPRRKTQEYPTTLSEECSEYLFSFSMMGLPMPS